MSPVEDSGAIRAELRNHDQRLTANHDSIGNLRERVATQETKISVINTELRETREDTREIRVDLKSLKRGAWALVGTGLALITALIPVIIQISS